MWFVPKVIGGFVVSLLFMFATISEVRNPRTYSAFEKTFTVAPTSVIGYIIILLPAIFCVFWFFACHSYEEKSDKKSEWISGKSFIFIFLAIGFWQSAPIFSYLAVAYSIIIMTVNFSDVLRGANFLFIASPLERPAEKILEQTIAGNLDDAMKVRLTSEVKEASIASTLPTVFPDVTVRKSSEAVNQLRRAEDVLKDRATREEK